MPGRSPHDNKVEIYFSIVQLKVLTPNDFDDLALLARTLNEFEGHWSGCMTRPDRIRL